MISSGILLSADQFLLVTLLVRIGVMASLATILVRYRFFQRILLAEDRGRREDWQFAALFGVFIALGIGLRLLLGYVGADISLAGILLIGLLTGPVTGAVAGAVIGIFPSLGGEMLTIPMNALYGVVGGLAGKTTPTRDAVWNFSPLTWINVYRFLKANLFKTRLSWQVALIFACIAMDAAAIAVGRHFAEQRLLFSLRPEGTLVLVAMFVSTIACLGIPLKIWNSTRVEMMLEKQGALVARARFDTLRSQINPHFLFNTLNSIAATIRSDPAKARQILVKLSGILRRLLHTEEDTTPLRDELAFIDAYLDIELARFGPEKLRIDRQIDPQTLDVQVPSMILQPLVENAIQHGLSPKMGGGGIRISTRLVNGQVVIEIEDDGLGISEDRIPTALISGIGLSNVNERLQVMFGPQCRLQLDSRPGRGTRVRIDIPDPSAQALPRTVLG
ncbi:MAG: histidine kinase [candidate division Zixibacteria bacterium]|nr:histidine kinase [candidate division Zixibacteria bacterium]